MKVPIKTGFPCDILTFYEREREGRGALIRGRRLFAILAEGVDPYLWEGTH